MAAPDIDDILEALNDNADYAADDSVAKARAFVSACTRAMLFTPETYSHTQASTSFNHDSIRAAKADAERWLREHSGDARDGGGPTGTYADFRNFR